MAQRARPGARATVRASSCGALDARAEIGPGHGAVIGIAPQPAAPRRPDPRASGARDRGRGARDLSAGRAVGADAARLRPLRLARLGTPDDPRPSRHQRRAVLEAAAVSVHAPLRAVRALPAVAVDDHLGGDLAQRRDLRGADRLQADRRAARAPLGRLRGRGIRGRGAARDHRLHALRAQRSVGPADRVAVPGRGRLPPVEATALGVRATGARLAGAARGVAVHRRLRDLGLDQGAIDALDGRGRRGRGPGAVVRSPGADLAQLLPGGQQCAGLGAGDSRQQGDRDHQPLLQPARDLAGAAGAAVGRPGRGAPGSSDADPGRRRGGVGDRRDRVRAARLAGGAHGTCSRPRPRWSWSPQSGSGGC